MFRKFYPLGTPKNSYPNLDRAGENTQHTPSKYIQNNINYTQEKKRHKNKVNASKRRTSCNNNNVENKHQKKNRIQQQQHSYKDQANKIQHTCKCSDNSGTRTLDHMKASMAS